MGTLWIFICYGFHKALNGLCKADFITWELLISATLEIKESTLLSVVTAISKFTAIQRSPIYYPTSVFGDICSTPMNHENQEAILCVPRPHAHSEAMMTLWPQLAYSEKETAARSLWGPGRSSVPPAQKIKFSLCETKSPSRRCFHFSVSRALSSFLAKVA